MSSDQKKDKDSPAKNSKRQDQFNAYIKYSGLAFQMLATIGIFVFIGYKLDQWQNNSTPIYLIIFSLVGIGVSLYQVIREFI